ncbi:endo-1,4-beta-xylanase [Roseomonas xinghualingensis]|uniref:endo-1,4-beta-xylanase n=1 Tax=Roseomonas xinghualingensis TaxID=2986475 RepID=UPI0021F1E52C|nr:endo-1,4-beta-xylanase [Roseomonas sp. SXEYE001]MCV4208886.1 endo-1,4-beta-xylanase [Roseomonas sp. SXEYE001]
MPGTPSHPAGGVPRRAILGTALACGTALSARGQQPASSGQEGPGLWEIARGRGITFGAAVQANLLASDKAYEAAFAREAGILVPEFEAKWSTLQPKEGEFDFTQLDAILQWGQARGRATRGHALVWHTSFPQWAVEALAEGAPRARAVMGAHISKVLSTTRLRIRDWDVVNEPVADPPGSDTPQAEGELRDSPFLRALGPSYIETAFRMAREQDPTLRLVLNDYGVEEDTPWAAEKRRRLLALVRRLVQARVPIDAVGIQAHLQMDRPFNPQVFGDFVRALRAEGLSVLVTEMDIREASNMPDDYVARDRLVAERASAFVSSALEAGVKTVLTWGLVDRYSWLVIEPAVGRRDGKLHRGLPLDWEYNRKEMWHAMARLFAAV